MKVIQNVNTGLFWSNDWGWGDLYNAERFTEMEAGKLNLPIEGEWVDAFKATLANNEPTKVSDWMPEEPGSHCCMRIVEDGDPTNIAHRVAFIEKTPRVRINPFTDEDDDWRNWESGPKGSGGSGDARSQKIYGYDIDSRDWCDEQLRKLGYKIPIHLTKKPWFCNRAGPMGGGCKDSWHVGGNYGSHVCRNAEHHDNQTGEDNE